MGRQRTQQQPKAKASAVYRTALLAALLILVLPFVYYNLAYRSSFSLAQDSHFPLMFGRPLNEPRDEPTRLALAGWQVAQAIFLVWLMWAASREWHTTEPSKIQPVPKWTKRISKLLYRDSKDERLSRLDLIWHTPVLLTLYCLSMSGTYTPAVLAFTAVAIFSAADHENRLSRTTELLEVLFDFKKGDAWRAMINAQLTYQKGQETRAVIHYWDIDPEYVKAFDADLPTSDLAQALHSYQVTADAYAKRGENDVTARTALQSNDARYITSLPRFPLDYEGDIPNNLYVDNWIGLMWRETMHLRLCNEAMESFSFTDDVGWGNVRAKTQRHHVHVGATPAWVHVYGDQAYQIFGNGSVDSIVVREITREEVQLHGMPESTKQFYADAIMEFYNCGGNARCQLAADVIRMGNLSSKASVDQKSISDITGCLRSKVQLSVLTQNLNGTSSNQAKERFVDVIVVGFIWEACRFMGERQQELFVGYLTELSLS